MRPTPPLTRTVSSNSYHRSNNNHKLSSRLVYPCWVSVCAVGLVLALNVGTVFVLPYYKPMRSPSATRVVNGYFRSALGGTPDNSAALRGGADGKGGRLAVVVPAHAGDLYRALSSLAEWPTKCSPVTQQRVDLVLYKAEVEDEISREALELLKKTAGRCFAGTKIVYGELTPEENVYPQGPSVQFYKMYLDPKVKAHFAVYDVFAIIEWDVLVVHESSFEQLYHSAFRGGEPFWVKGSILAGTNFHETAAVTGMWHVLGHINGNAMYNNTDPAFVEFVDYTLARWEYLYPYDVALWATIADFPYSWPLWQRYSRNFVSTKLIANVGFLDVDNTTITNAIAGNTLFIHGSTTGGGSKHNTHSDEVMFDDAGSSPPSRDSSPAKGATKGQDLTCKFACGDTHRRAFSLPGTNTRRADADSNGKSEKAVVSGVCDVTCAPSEERERRFDGFMCGAGDAARFGTICRTCYTDQAEALNVEKQLRRKEKQGSGQAGKHVIMCNTLRPPAAVGCDPKCAIKEDTVCDQTCGSGRYGDYNCNWRDHGLRCRHCFTDVREALLADVVAKSRGGRVIMCDTHEPPRMPPGWEHERETSKKGAHGRGVALSAKSNVVSATASPKTAADKSYASIAGAPFSENMVRGNLCAVVPGHFVFIEETEVTVRSVVHFMPGMRVRVPVHPAHFHAFNSSMGDIPGVQIMDSSYVSVAALLADKYCGEGTELIYYLSPGELVSRTFTFKDTHSPRGDLLVSFAEVPRVGEENAQQSRATTAILGFHSPSFTYGTDLILPAGVNNGLRELLLQEEVGSEERREIGDDDEYAVHLAARFEGVCIAEVLAALAYSQNTPGVWFLNPPQWVTHHMFKEASIWEVPLIKPRFGCSFDVSLAFAGFDMADALRHNLARFQGGGVCEGGYLELTRDDLNIKRTLEFGDATGTTMPDVKKCNISVMYTLPVFPETPVNGHHGQITLSLLRASLSSVVAHFPAAHEVVIVAAKKDKKAVQDMVTAAGDFDILPGDGTLPFPIRVKTDADAGSQRRRRYPVAMPRFSSDSLSASQLQSYRKMIADVYCDGDFVLYMEDNQVLLGDLTYDSFFHFGKPVVPYGRYPKEEDKQIAKCREIETADLFGEPLNFRFTLFNTNVYPRAMYTGLRRFIADLHGYSNGNAGTEVVGIPTFEEVMSSSFERSWSQRPMAAAAAAEPEGCVGIGQEPGGGVAEFIGAYMWARTHEAVYWLSTDPLDKRREDWDVDVYSKYAFSCTAYHANNVAAVQTTTGGADGRSQEGVVERYLKDFSRVDSLASCGDFQSRWASQFLSERKQE